jgi:hypothetical protein
MKENHIVKNVTLTSLTKFLNESSLFGKHTKKPFTTNDVRQYILLGHIPYYMGGNVVEESDTKADGVKLYNLRG